MAGTLGWGIPTPESLSGALGPLSSKFPKVKVAITEWNPLASETGTLKDERNIPDASLEIYS